MRSMRERRNSGRRAMRSLPRNTPDARDDAGPVSKVQGGLTDRRALLVLALPVRRVEPVRPLLPSMLQGANGAVKQLRRNQSMNRRTEVRNARLCGVCGGSMLTVKRGVYRCMAGCWHCPCCGGHFRRDEGCPCRSCRNCGEKALAGRACGNCGLPSPRSAPRNKTHGRANLRAWR